MVEPAVTVAGEAEETIAVDVAPVVEWRCALDVVPVDSRALLAPTSPSGGGTHPVMTGETE